jgi:hypothetical protein
MVIKPPIVVDVEQQMLLLFFVLTLNNYFFNIYMPLLNYWSTTEQILAKVTKTNDVIYLI